MITWDKNYGWAQRDWGYQVYFQLWDAETGEFWNEASGFEQKPTEDEVAVAAQKIIERIVQARNNPEPSEVGNEKDKIIAELQVQVGLLIKDLAAKEKEILDLKAIIK